MIFQNLQEAQLRIAAEFYPSCILLLLLPLKHLDRLMLLIFWLNPWEYCKDKVNQAIKFWNRSTFLCIVYGYLTILDSTFGSHFMCISYCLNPELMKAYRLRNDHKPISSIEDKLRFRVRGIVPFQTLQRICCHCWKISNHMFQAVIVYSSLFKYFWDTVVYGLKHQCFPHMNESLNRAFHNLHRNSQLLTHFQFVWCAWFQVFRRLGQRLVHVSVPLALRLCCV